MKKIFCYIFISAILLGLSGCSGSIKNMQVSSVDTSTVPPKEGKAKVVFMRPSSFGFAIQSSVFTIKNNIPSVIGIIAAKKKLGQDFEPGEYIFMVIGESADFMYADLKANKTYYTLITPRMGLWKARFSLKPLNTAELNSEDFQEWVAETQTVESNSSTQYWANQNRESIEEKYLEYYEDWMEEDEDERPKLIDYISN